MPDITITATITSIAESADGVMFTLDSHPDKTRSTAEALSTAIAGGEVENSKEEPQHYGALFMPGEKSGGYEEGQTLRITFGKGSKESDEPKEKEVDEFVDETKSARLPEY